jgi:RNA polymerase sigma-54 factor
MEQKLSMNLSQKLAMTVKLQQAIQILQLSSQELRTTIEKEYLENPALEMEEGTDIRESGEKLTDRYSIEDISALANYLGEDEKRPRSSQNDVKQSFETAASTDLTLEQELLEQVNFTFQRDEEKGIAVFIVGSIDSRGYLTTPVSEIARAMQTIEPAVEAVLAVVQRFEPVGVGARSLQECLTIQAKQQGIYEGLVAAVIDCHLDHVARAQYKNIAADEGCSLSDVQLAVDIIRTLNPKPGSSYGNASSNYIVPDVVVRKNGDSYIVLVNDYGIPQLHISQVYRNAAGFDTQTKKYIEQRVNSAAWLIKSIGQRRETLKNVVTEIVRQQMEYLEKGPQYLRPLLMKTVAENIDVHESTVSRAVANKYVEMPHGVIMLKKFFTANLASAATGEELIAGQVKSTIEGLIKGEDPKKPFSDQQLTVLLGQRDMKISRRTVMKYREQLGFPSSVKRKRY